MMRHSIAKCPICSHTWTGTISKRNLNHILKYQIGAGLVQVRAGPDGKRQYQLTEKGKKRVERKWGLGSEKKPT